MNTNQQTDASINTNNSINLVATRQLSTSECAVQRSFSKMVYLTLNLLTMNMILWEEEGEKLRPWKSFLNPVTKMMALKYFTFDAALIRNLLYCTTNFYHRGLIELYTSLGKSSFSSHSQRTLMFLGRKFFRTEKKAVKSTWIRISRCVRNFVEFHHLEF